jgi:sodium transport system permease protein
LTPTRIIFLKEMREMLRDKRVRSAAFVMPILLIFVFLSAFGFLIDTLRTPSSQRIHVVQADNEIVQAFRAAGVRIIEVPSVEEGKELIRRGDARLVLEFPSELPAPGQPEQATVAAYYDPKQEMGKIALGAVSGTLREFNRNRVEALLSQQGLPGEAAEPLRLVEHEVKVGDEAGAGELIIGLLPYLIVIWAFYGGFGIVADLVAGEKEKNTLETLLIAPISRVHVAMGKFYALSVICLASSLSSVVGLALVAILNLPMTRAVMEGGIGVSPTSLVVMILALLPIVALFSASMLAVSAFSKNIREAQTYLASLSFLVIMPAVFSQFIGYTDFARALWIHTIPVLNTATAIRGALMGNIDWSGLLVGMATNGILAAIAIAVAIRLFRREEVLIRV